MAEFQQSINIMPATGLPGQVVQMFGYTPTPYNYVSDGTITAGTFAFLDPAEEANGGPMFAHSKVASGGRLIGFVQRIHSGLLNTPYVTNTEVYEKASQSLSLCAANSACACLVARPQLRAKVCCAIQPPAQSLLALLELLMTPAGSCTCHKVLLLHLKAL